MNRTTASAALCLSLHNINSMLHAARAQRSAACSTLHLSAILYRYSVHCYTYILYPILHAVDSRRRGILAIAAPLQSSGRRGGSRRCCRLGGSPLAPASQPIAVTLATSRFDPPRRSRSRRSSVYIVSVYIVLYSVAQLQ